MPRTKRKPLAYRFGGFYRGPRHNATLYALADLLIPYLPELASFPPTQRQLLNCVYRLRNDLIGRTQALSAAGWQFGKSSYWPIADCPPRPGTWLPESRPCNVYYYCPFCWVRRVLEPNYDRMMSFFYKTLQPGPKPKLMVPADIVVWHQRAIYGIDDDLAGISKCLLDDAHDLYHRQLIDPAGMIYLSTMEPLGNDCVTIHSRNLLVLPPGGHALATSLLGTDLEGDCTVFAAARGEVDHESICLAVAECCSFPVETLLGDIAPTVRLLNLRHRPLRRNTDNLSQCSAIYGRLRDLSGYTQDQRYRSAFREATA